MAQEEKKKEEETTKEQPDPAIKPLPPREASDDELDTVVGGLASTGGLAAGDVCLT